MKIFIARFSTEGGQRDWVYVMANNFQEADQTFRTWFPRATVISIEERDYHSAVIAGHGTFYNDNYERVR